MGGPQGKEKVEEIVSYLDIDAKEISGHSKLRLTAPPDILQNPLIWYASHLPTATPNINGVLLDSFFSIEMWK